MTQPLLVAFLVGLAAGILLTAFIFTFLNQEEDPAWGFTQPTQKQKDQEKND